MFSLTRRALAPFLPFLIPSLAASSSSLFRLADNREVIQPWASPTPSSGEALRASWKRRTSKPLTSSAWGEDNHPRTTPPRESQFSEKGVATQPSILSAGKRPTDGAQDDADANAYRGGHII